MPPSHAPRRVFPDEPSATITRRLRLRAARARGRLRVPGPLRSFVRSGEVGLVVLAAVVGSVAGVLVSAMSLATVLAHQVLYGLEAGQRLSGAPTVGTIALLVLPATGGALLGLTLLLANRLRGNRARQVVDPIEANALHGGRLSLRDSVLVTVQNLISNGCGASVGLEAGYTQISAGVASRLGLSFELRRGDLRVLVGCGAAAAIAAAFDAPLAGAFYAFELIIGTYSIAALTPVVAAALVGAATARGLASGSGMLMAVPTAAVTSGDYLPSLLLGLVAGVLGICIMQGVTLTEALVRRTRVPVLARPALGGLCVSAIALATTPQVLSAGHGALHVNFADGPAVTVLGLAVLFAAKATASALSIGTGFRGGLFFASLFLGAIAGKLFALAAPSLGITGLDPISYAVVGMSALAVAVIGGPLTMTFLALEVTRDLAVTGLVLIAVIAASLTVRKTFGYSFATWRFHLRGEAIRSAHDIGWIRTLTVGQLMRREVRTVRGDMTLAAFARAFPLGSGQRVVAVDATDRYAGIVLVTEAHAALREEEDGKAQMDGAQVDDVLRCQQDFLLAQMNAKEAAALFDRTESEALAVLESPVSRKVIGLLTESHTLRRYSEELDRQRRAAAGEPV